MGILTTYLLLDGAQIDDLVPLIYRLQDSPSVHALYQHTAYAEWADSGPFLIRIEPGEPLARHFEQHWQAAEGIRLESAAEPGVLAEHLRSLVHARVEGGEVLLFRFYDPRILPLWLETLSPEARDQALGPVAHVYLPTADEPTFGVNRGDTATEPATYSDQPWITLSAEQLDVMNGAKQTVFDERLREHLSTCFPEEMALMDDAQQRRLVRLCRESAASHGYSSAEEVARWSSLLLMFGDDFPEAPEHARYRELLAQPGRLPEQRLDDVMLAATEDKESA
ncbi:DUF4123 domain-containing protein [Pseudomonas indica]|uniref:DUF4123 domain-containing protein n=1 Tax=Pseudomonas indica TaxID=137658 RepID=UPI0023F8402A|nr:DUF4123 domain-containing protein [Pseudomonas indica]MBU3056395.1 DUF4123 domain-containing protein [Pseudomonas indica]